MEYCEKNLFNKNLNTFVEAVLGGGNEASAEYKEMLSSKIYTHGLYKDLKEFAAFLAEGNRTLDLGTGIGFIPYFFMGEDVKFSAIDIKISDFDKKYYSGLVEDEETRENALKREAYVSNIWSSICEQTGTEFSYYNGKDIPFPDNEFDAVIMHAVWEHIPPKIHPVIIKEIKRVLKENGILYITRLPRRLAYQEHLSRLLGMGGHEYLIKEKEFNKFMTENNFIKEKSGRIDLFFSFPAKVWNPFSGIINLLNDILLATPLSIFAHEYKGVYRKSGQ